MKNSIRLGLAPAALLASLGLALANPAQALIYGPTDLVLDATPSGTTAVQVMTAPVTAVPTMVQASLSFSVNPAAPVPTTNGTMVTMSVTCPGGTTTSATQNIVKGTPLSLKPHLLTTGGAGTCTVTARAQTGSGQPWSESPHMTVSVTYSAVSVVVAAPGAVSGRPDTPSVLVQPGEDIDIAQVIAAPAGPTRWKTQTKVTGCTGIGGSRDPGGPYLCEGHVGPTPITIRLIVQRRCDTAPTSATNLVDKTVTISAATHHLMDFQTGSVTRCPNGPTRIKTYLENIGSTAFVAHRIGTSAVTQW